MKVKLGKLAFLDLLQTFNKPIAATIAYSLDKKSDSQLNFPILELGSDIFDASISMRGKHFALSFVIPDIS